MAMVNVVRMLAWSKGWRQLRLFLQSPHEPGEFSLCSKYDDRAINIVKVKRKVTSRSQDVQHSV